MVSDQIIQSPYRELLISVPASKIRKQDYYIYMAVLIWEVIFCNSQRSGFIHGMEKMKLKMLNDKIRIKNNSG